MKKIALVTGAHGFVGRETVRQLEERGWQVLSVVRNAKTTREIEVDLGNPGFPSKLLGQSRPDAIVHLAARVDFSDNTEADLYEQNVFSTAALLALAKYWDASFVFASTVLLTEASGPDLSMPYIKSKWLAEQLVETSGVRATIFRIAGVFGRNGPSHLGLNRSIDTVLKERRPMITGSGNAKRNYIYVKDVAKCIVAALDKNITGTHVIAGKEALSINSMLQILCDAFLPGSSPKRSDGPETGDQVFALSDQFIDIYSFQEAIEDLHREMIQ